MNSTDNRAVRWGMYVLSLVVLAVVWQLAAAGTGPLLASFTETMSRLVELVSNGELPAALWSSGRIFLTGLGISIVLGLPLGLVFARFPLVTAAVETYVYALYAIPVITLVPFILASVGFDFRAKVLVVVLTAAFLAVAFTPVLSNYFGLTGAAAPVFTIVLPALVGWFVVLSAVYRFRVLDRILGIADLPGSPVPGR